MSWGVDNVREVSHEIEEIYRKMKNLNKYEDVEVMKKRFPPEQVKVIAEFYTNGIEMDEWKIAEMTFRVYEECDKFCARFGYFEKPIESININGDRMTVKTAAGIHLTFYRKHGNMI